MYKNSEKIKYEDINSNVVLQKVVCYNNDEITTKFLAPVVKVPSVSISGSKVRIYDSLSFIKNDCLPTCTKSLNMNPKKSKLKSTRNLLCFEIENTQMKIFKDPLSPTFVLLFYDKQEDKENTSVHLHLTRKSYKNNTNRNDKMKKKLKISGRVKIKCSRNLYTKYSETLTNKLIKNLRRKNKSLEKTCMHILLQKTKKNIPTQQRSLHCFLNKTLQTKLNLEMYPFTQAQYPHNEILIGAVLKTKVNDGKKFIITRKVHNHEEINGVVDWLSSYCNGYKNNHIPENAMVKIQEEIESKNIEINNIQAIVTVNPRNKKIFFQFKDDVLKKLAGTKLGYYNKTIKLKNKRFISGDVLKLKLNSIRIYVDEIADTNIRSVKHVKLISEQFCDKLKLLLKEATKENANATAQNIVDILEEFQSMKNSHSGNQTVEHIDNAINSIKKEMEQYFYHTSVVKHELEDYFNKKCSVKDLALTLENAISYDDKLKEFKLKKYESIPKCSISNEISIIRKHMIDILENDDLYESRENVQNNYNIYQSIKEFSTELREAYEKDFLWKNLKKTVATDENTKVNKITNELESLHEALQNLTQLYQKIDLENDELCNDSIPSRPDSLSSKKVKLNVEDVKNSNNRIILKKLADLKEQLSAMNSISENVSVSNLYSLENPTGIPKALLPTEKNIDNEPKSKDFQTDKNVIISKPNLIPKVVKAETDLSFKKQSLIPLKIHQAFVCKLPVKQDTNDGQQPIKTLDDISLQQSSQSKDNSRELKTNNSSNSLIEDASSIEVTESLNKISNLFEEMKTKFENITFPVLENPSEKISLTNALPSITAKLEEWQRNSIELQRVLDKCPLIENTKNIPQFHDANTAEHLNTNLTKFEQITTKPANIICPLARSVKENNRERTGNSSKEEKNTIKFTLTQKLIENLSSKPKEQHKSINSSQYTTSPSILSKSPSPKSKTSNLKSATKPDNSKTVSQSKGNGPKILEMLKKTLSSSVVIRQSTKNKLTPRKQTKQLVKESVTKSQPGTSKMVVKSKTIAANKDKSTYKKVQNFIKRVSNEKIKKSTKVSSDIKKPNEIHRLTAKLVNPKNGSTRILSSSYIEDVQIIHDISPMYKDKLAKSSNVLPAKKDFIKQYNKTVKNNDLSPVNLPKRKGSKKQSSSHKQNKPVLKKKNLNPEFDRTESFCTKLSISSRKVDINHNSISLSMDTFSSVQKIFFHKSNFNVKSATKVDSMESFFKTSCSFSTTSEITPIKMLHALTKLSVSADKVCRLSEHRFLKGIKIARPATNPMFDSLGKYRGMKINNATFRDALKQFQKLRHLVDGCSIDSINSPPQYKENESTLSYDTSKYKNTPPSEQDERQPETTVEPVAEYQQTFFHFLTPTPRKVSMPIKSTDSSDMRRLFGTGPAEQDTRQATPTVLPPDRPETKNVTRRKPQLPRTKRTTVNSLTPSRKTTKATINRTKTRKTKKLVETTTNTSDNSLASHKTDQTPTQKKKQCKICMPIGARLSRSGESRSGTSSQRTQSNHTTDNPSKKTSALLRFESTPFGNNLICQNFIPSQNKGIIKKPVSSHSIIKTTQEVMSKISSVNKLIRDMIDGANETMQPIEDGQKYITASGDAVHSDASPHIPAKTREALINKIQKTLKDVTKTVINISSNYIPMVNQTDKPGKKTTESEKIIIDEPNGQSSVVEIIKYVNDKPSSTCKKILSRSLRNSLMILKKINEASKSFEESKKSMQAYKPFTTVSSQVSQKSERLASRSAKVKIKPIQTKIYLERKKHKSEEKLSFKPAKRSRQSQNRYQVQVKTVTASPDLDKTTKKLLTKPCQPDEYDNLTLEHFPPIQSEYPRRDHQMHTSVENTFLFKLVSFLEPEIHCADKHCATCASDSVSEKSCDSLPLNCQLGNRKGGKNFNFQKYITDLRTRHGTLGGIFRDRILQAFPVSVRYTPRKNLGSQQQAIGRTNRNIPTPIMKIATPKPAKKTVSPKPNKVKKNETNSKKKMEEEVSKAERSFSKNYSTLPFRDVEESSKTGKSMQLQKYIEVVEDKFLKTFSLPEKEKAAAYKGLELEIKNMLDILASSDTQEVRIGVSDSLERISKDEDKKYPKESINVLKDLKTFLSTEKTSNEDLLKKKTLNKSQPTICYESISFINSLQKIISKQSLNSNLTGGNKTDSLKTKHKSMQTKENSITVTKAISTQCKLNTEDLSKCQSDDTMCSSDYETICEESVSGDVAGYLMNISIINMCVPQQISSIECLSKIEQLILLFNTFEVTDIPDTMKSVVFLKQVSSSHSNGSSPCNSSTDLNFYNTESWNVSNNEEIGYKISCRKPMSKRMLDFLEIITSLSFETLPKDFSKEKIIVFYKRVQFIIQKYYTPQCYLLNGTYQQILYNYSSYIEELIENLSKSETDINTLLKKSSSDTDGYRLMSFKDTRLRKYRPQPDYNLVDKVLLENVYNNRGKSLLNQKRINTLCHTLIVNLQFTKSNRTTLNSCLRGLRKKRIKLKSVSKRKLVDKDSSTSSKLILNKLHYNILFCTYIVTFIFIFSCLTINFRCE